jgi:hypothetical protein
MREFADIERELNLMKFTDSRNGTLYCVPTAPGAPRLIVRKFDGELAPALIPAYVDIAASAEAWIAADPELAALVRIEQPSEVGRNFIARRHFNATTLDAFLGTDPEEDPPEPPPELARMQTRFRDRTKAASGLHDALLTSILSRSVLERSLKTFYDYDAEQFVIADLKLTRDELKRWDELVKGDDSRFPIHSMQ